AEALPFDDETFDLVYSWGVLHHTPNTQRALDEAYRVLKPTGEVRMMLYSRRSWVALGVWLRHGLLAGRPWRTVTSLLETHFESPGTKAYTQPEIVRLLHRFRNVNTQRFVTPYDRRFAGPLANVAG